jgi:hypothetical protein
MKWPDLNDAPALEFSDEQGTQDRKTLFQTLQFCIDEQAAIRAELGEQEFTCKLLPTNRLLLTSVDGASQLVAYMADPYHEQGNRLVLDEYVPELGVDL